MVFFQDNELQDVHNLQFLTESNTFIVFVIIFGIILLSGLILHLKDYKYGIGSAVIVVVVFAFIIHKYVPAVYIVTECGEVEKGLLLYPQTLANGYSLTFGSHSYVLNTSQNSLGIGTVFYGDISPEKHADKIVEQVVLPGTVDRVKVTGLDYFFEDSRRTLRSREKGLIRYQVECMD